MIPPSREGTPRTCLGRIPAKHALMPVGYDAVKTEKQQGSPAFQVVGGVHIVVG